MMMGTQGFVSGDELWGSDDYAPQIVRFYRSCIGFTDHVIHSGAVIIYRRLMDNLYHASKLIRWRDKNHASKLIRWRDNNDIAIPLDNSDI